MGDVLRLDGPDTAAPGNRAWRPRMRTYLAIPGGFDVPMVLGSRSTALGAGFGGLDGRAVRAGDILRCTDVGALTGAPHRWPAAPLALPSLAASGTATLRAVPGPWAADSGNVLASLTAQVWTVGSASDRVGLRLDGDALPGVFPADLASHGLVTGAIQVPPGGRPIVLLPDRQPTGGYAVVAVVITADRPVLGQLAPGDQVAFRLVTPGEARTALRESRDLFQRALQHLDEDRRWDALADHAGG
jgi:allophanate hydrolase subunit 2